MAELDGKLALLARAEMLMLILESSGHRCQICCQVDPRDLIDVDATTSHSYLGAARVRIMGNTPV